MTLEGKVFNVRTKAKTKNRHNQAPHLTRDITWESDKNTIKHHIQEVSSFPAGDHNATMNRQEIMTRNIKKNKKYLLKKIYEDVTEDIFDMSNVRIFKVIEKKKNEGYLYFVMSSVSRAQ